MPGLVGRLFPGLALLRRYRRVWLRADLLAGLTVGAMLVPQCMAYAEIAGMPPETGFYAVLFALPVYALVGTSRHLGVGPEGVVIGTARANDIVVEQLRRGGVIERIGDDNVHATINRAVRAFRDADQQQ